MRFWIKIFICWTFTIGLLYWQYPWSTYYGQFRFGWRETMASYVVLASVMAGIGCWLSPLVSNRLLTRTSSWAALAGLGFALTLVSLVVLAISFGPYGLSIPGTRIRGIFFAEWKFVNFILYCAIPFAITASVVMNWQRKGQVTTSGRRA